MAAKSLGTLTLDLIAKVGGFVAGMDQAERASAKWRKKVEENAKKAGTAIGAGMAVAAGATALWVRHSIDQAAQLENLARVSNASTTEFQKFAYAARTVGIDNEKLSDIFKDVNDRVGEFLTTGSGPMIDFFEKVAPKVGVTAEQFKNLSGPEALGLYISTLEKAGANQQELTFFMEAMAGDSAKLIPLLQNNASGLRSMADEAANLGLVLSEETIKNAAQFNRDLVVLGDVAGIIGQQIAAELLPELTKLTKELKDPETVQAAVSMAKGIAGAFTTIIEGARETVKFIEWIGESMAAFVHGPAADDIVRLQDNLAEWQEMLDNPLKRPRVGAQGFQYFNEEEIRANMANTQKLIDQFWANQANRSVKVPEPKVEPKKPTGLNIDLGAEEKAKAAAAEQKKLAGEAARAAKAIEDQVLALEKEAWATGKTSAEIKLYELALDGATASQLERAATAMESVKSFELQADQVRYLTSLEEDLANARKEADLEVAGIGMGSRMKEELAQVNSIREAYAALRADLTRAQGTPDALPADLYEARLEALQDAQDQEVEIYLDGIKRKEEAEADFLNGITAAWEDYVDFSGNIAAQMEDIFGSALEGLTTGIADSLTDAIFHAEDLSEALKEVGRTVIEEVVGALIEMGVRQAVLHAAEMAGITTESAAKVAAASTVSAAEIAAIGATSAASVSATAATTATQTAAAATTATAWTPAAIAASIGSFGTAAAIGLAAVVAALAFSGGFRKGGYTGSGGVDEVAGVVHGKEFVFDAESTSRLGVSTLEALRSGRDITDPVSRVTSIQQQRGATVDRRVSQVFNINTPNPDAFRASQRQIARSANRTRSEE